MKYKRILLKLSGQMLGGEGRGFSPRWASKAVQEIKSVQSQGVQVSVLVGGGNFVRARSSQGLSRITADFMGMTGTVLNALGLKDILKKAGIKARILSALNVEKITEDLVIENAVSYLENGEVVVFSGGTGSPFFTTDTAAALRALEIDADILLKATDVDGVYTDDPAKNAKAKLYSGSISYREALNKNLKIMDSSAFSILSENKLKVHIFNFSKKGNLKKAVNGEDIGTVIE
ncbi:MAG: UMP kinase [Elusimicrobiota bacterium]